MHTARNRCPRRQPRTDESSAPRRSFSRWAPGRRKPSPSPSADRSPAATSPACASACVRSSRASGPVRSSATCTGAREELGIRLVDRGSRALGGRVRGIEGRSRPLQGAVHRCDARLEQLRHLGRLPAQHLAEDEDGALAGRQVLERGDERELDRLAGLGDVGRIGSPSGTTSPSGTGSIHVTFGSTFRFSATGSRAGPRSIGRARRLRPSSRSKQTFVAIR